MYGYEAVNKVMTSVEGLLLVSNLGGQISLQWVVGIDFLSPYLEYGIVPIIRCCGRFVNLRIVYHLYCIFK